MEIIESKKSLKSIRSIISSGSWNKANLSRKIIMASVNSENRHSNIYVGIFEIDPWEFAKSEDIFRLGKKLE